MKTDIRNTLIIFCLFVAMAAIAAAAYFFNRIPMNEAGTIGNTAGNLNNRGLFCEDEGVVYFSNAYDKGTLYSMNPDETNIQKINLSQVSYINAGGEYLYYYQEGVNSTNTGLGFVRTSVGVYRCSKDGSSIACLKKDPSAVILLVDNHLYYQHYNAEEGMTLYKAKIDKTEETQIADYIINPASYQNGTIYFYGNKENHYLYGLDTSTDSIRTVWEGNLYMPTAYGDYVYYLDLSNNFSLCRYSLSDGSTQLLTSDRVENYNIYGDYIYYQKNGIEDGSQTALKRIRTDGTEEEVVAQGNYENINITSNYVYFNEFQTSVPVYKTPVNGPVNVTTFTAARDAVVAAEP